MEFVTKEIKGWPGAQIADDPSILITGGTYFILLHVAVNGRMTPNDVQFTIPKGGSIKNVKVVYMPNLANRPKIREYFLVLVDVEKGEYYTSFDDFAEPIKLPS